jgi:hypothetical protein
MGLSRLENFLKSARGTILYVNPNDLDSTDSIENQGNSLTRPFKTIQRALIESARFSYQRGLSNDRFGKTTILIYPGDHVVDNRPGWIPDGQDNFTLRNGLTSNNFPPFDLTTSFDLTDPDNALYKLNSIHGGVIIPRGTSIVGLDLRKTKIRPKYVPDPTNDNIERSAIFRVTGSCYFWQFSIFDADPNGQCYVDYTSNLFVPNFSHHKLSCFEYADGVNDVYIKDEFWPSGKSYDRTDLEMYYEKVGLAYGQSSGRPIEPDYPSSGLDIQPKIDEYRIVGSTGLSVGISSIKAGNGVITSNIITVTTTNEVPGLDVDTPIRIENIGDGYDGQFVVTEKLNDTSIAYQVQNAPSVALPSPTGGIISLVSDTVTSASPYIFNLSLRSVYGMCGVLADGSKASGFKSMVIAQFTGIGLQKDSNAFVVYNESDGQYNDNTVPGNENISTNSRAVFKPEYRNFHIKCTNDAFIQNVSIFAIGYAEHFSVESGGDMSVTNSNSNFGAKSLVASGFRKEAFAQDDAGYITHIIPPKEISIAEKTIEFNSIDVAKTISVGSTGNLYLYDQTNSDVPPENVLEGYRIGAKGNDTIKVLIPINGVTNEYSARIVMANSQTSSEKSFNVVNNISNKLYFSQSHTLNTGETIRILSDNGELPDGISPNVVYYAITNTAGIGSTELRIAKTFSDATSHTTSDQRNITFNTNGGSLKVVSRVSDKNSGDVGHPIQYDSTNSQWYIKVSTASTENNIYSIINSLGSGVLGSATPRTYITRRKDDRSSVDTIYRFRYVIPASSSITFARPPSDGFIIQESNASIGSTTGEIQTYFGSGSLNNVNDQRNFRFIAGANWSSGNSRANIITEIPHNLSVGSQVEILNVKSTYNTSGIGNSAYNGTFSVVGINSSKSFSVDLETDPGSFINDTTNRTTSLPYFKKKKYKNTYYIYRTQETQRYIPGKQDGIYYLTVLNSSNSPSAQPFTEDKYSQSVKELYPQLNRDNPNSDPQEAKSAAVSSLLGRVIVDDVRNSITKETLTKVFKDIDVGVGITNITSSVDGTTHLIQTTLDHGLNRLTKAKVISGGGGYGYGSGSIENHYNAVLVGSAATAGKHATAKVTVSAAGTISAIKIMDGGSGYSIGETLNVVGIATTTGYTLGSVKVTSIYNNVGDSFRISGVKSENYQSYNNLYRITSVSPGAAKSFTAVSASALSNFSTNGVGETLTSDSFLYLTGKALSVSNLVYNNTTGIATVTTTSSHGLSVDSKVRVGGANQSFYNGDFIVTETLNLTSFRMNVGVSTISPSTSGTIYVYPEGYTSNYGVITKENENLNGRMISQYNGITSTLNGDVTTTTTDEIYINNIESLDINIGDYLQIDDEIVRVKTTVLDSVTTGNPIYVFRGVLGTKATLHTVNSVIKKIKINPIELRRHSIIRASGHTFEYVGFGPGNYSTAFPDKQDRQISAEEELLAQSTRKEGGINFYTGMNDKGISYNGNKKLSTITGQEEIFDTPVQTITGEDIGDLPALNILNPVEGVFSRSIKVDGGVDSRAISEFNGPVVFGNKVTSTSDKGFEVNSLFLQGDATVSRKYTVGISTPSLAGNPGDIVYNSTPGGGEYIGWVYSNENDWYRFGNISLSNSSDIYTFDKVGIGVTTPKNYQLSIGSTSMVVDSNGTGIGATPGSYRLLVKGSTNIIGTCYATKFSGDGSGLINLATDSLWKTNDSATGIYPGSSNYYVGIGTTAPSYGLELGTSGTGETDLYVNNRAVFAGTASVNNLNVTGVLTASNYTLGGGTGTINAGIVTSARLSVGTNGDTITSTLTQRVGLGTISPRARFDVEGQSRFKTYALSCVPVSHPINLSTPTRLSLDLSIAQNFAVTLNGAIAEIRLSNIPEDSSEFTIKFKQSSTGGYSVALNNFRTFSGQAISIAWPGGGIIPNVTSTANKEDIYSFRIFDGAGVNGGTSGIYGVVIGQNFI